MPIDIGITILFIYTYYRFNLHNEKKLKRYLTLPLIIPMYLLDLLDPHRWQSLIDLWRYISIICVTIDYTYGPIEDWLFQNKQYWIINLMITLQFFGTIGFYKFEALSIRESFWLTFISATTVGYGDVSAITSYGHIVTYIIVIAGNLIYGAILIGLIISWLKRREYKVNPSSFSEKIAVEFTTYKKGDVTINELEQRVNKIISKEEE